MGKRTVKQRHKRNTIKIIVIVIICGIGIGGLEYLSNTGILQSFTQQASKIIPETSSAIVNKVTEDGELIDNQTQSPTDSSGKSVITYYPNSVVQPDKDYTAIQNEIQRSISSHSSQSQQQSTIQKTDLDSLYAYTLKIVNDDRKANGLGPVTLSNINSAQNHADDQLNLKYFSHWNSDGVKPYVVYTKLGGRGAVAENDYYTYSTCPTSDCLPNTYDPYAEIQKGEDEMMNNDAASNWGHKKNILDPAHTQVNFGIAYDNERFYFVENFEDNLINWQTIKLQGTNLVLAGTINPGYSVSDIDVYSDPAPTPLTENDLDNSPPYNAGYYDQGTDVGMIVPALTGNEYYPNCASGKITATSSDGTSECLSYSVYHYNPLTPSILNTTIDVSKWLGTAGLHTIYLNLKDASGNQAQATSLTLEYLK